MLGFLYIKNKNKFNNLNSREELNETEIIEKKNLKKKIKNSEFHLMANSHQRKEFSKMREELDENSSLLVIDFTRWEVWGDKKAIVDLVACAYHKVIENDKKVEKIQYFDVISFDSKNDSYLLFESLKLLFKEEFFIKYPVYYLWSDGAAKHFKNRKSQFIISNSKEFFGYNIIGWDFYISNHAHNICDSHAKNFKQPLKNYMDKNQNRIDSLKLVKELVEKNNSNTKVLIIKDVRRDPFLEVTTFKKVRCFHSFRYLGKGIIKTMILTNKFYSLTKINEGDGLIQKLEQKNCNEIEEEE